MKILIAHESITENKLNVKVKINYKDIFINNDRICKNGCAI